MKDVLLTLSYSRMDTYKKCPRKYYYRYITKLPTKEWDHFSLGTLVHGALEHFHEEFKTDNSNTNLKSLMKNSFKNQRSEMEKKASLKPEVLQEAYGILQNYLDLMKNKGIGSKIISLEQEFNIPLNDKFSIMGFIDRLDMDDDGIYHIKDYKTTKSVNYMTPEQLLTYGIYLLDKFPDIKNFRGSYIMLKCDLRNLSYDFNIEDIEKEKKILIDCAEKITTEERWITRPTRLCDWCDFKDTCLNSW